MRHLFIFAVQGVSEQHSGVFFIALHVVFNVRDGSNDHLADFPTSTSTVYIHALVCVIAGRILQLCVSILEVFRKSTRSDRLIPPKCKTGRYRKSFFFYLKY